MTSIFTNKEIIPTDKDLKKALEKTYTTWLELCAFTKKAYPKATEEWNFSGVKYGWSFRIKDKKRAILYLLPRTGFFKVAMVFGQKATDEILNSPVNEHIKTELANAKVYAEGRGIRIEIKDRSLVKDIEKLIFIKLAH